MAKRHRCAVKFKDNKLNREQQLALDRTGRLQAYPKISSRLHLKVYIPVTEEHELTEQPTHLAAMLRVPHIQCSMISPALSSHMAACKAKFNRLSDCKDCPDCRGDCNRHT